MSTWIVSGTDSLATDSDQVKTIAANSKSITAATKAANCQLTITGHGMNAGEYVYITSVGGMTQLNALYHLIASVVDANNITIATDSTSYGTYTSGGTANVEGSTLQNPCNIRSVGHNISVGDVVNISGIAGTTQLNGNAYTVSAILSNDVFSIDVNATAFTRYTSGGSASLYVRAITGATQANPCQLTVSGHGRATGSRIYIENVSGMTQLNGKTFTITSTGTNTLTLDGVDSTAFSAFTSGGTISWVRDTIQNAVNRAVNGDTILVEKSTFTSIAGGVTFTWTRGSTSIGTSSTTVGTILVGDYIGPTTADLNGSTTTYYKVTAVSASAVTIENRFWHSDSVSSIVEAGCKRATPILEGVNANSIVSNSKSITCTGGYTFANNTAPVRDSATLYKHAVNKTSSQHIGLNASAGSFSYLNFCDCYCNAQLIGSGSPSYDYFTVISPLIYSLLISATNEPTVSNYMAFSGSASYGALQASSSVTLGSSCYHFSFPSAGGQGVTCYAAYVKNAKVRVSNYGLQIQISGGRFEDSDVKFVADRGFFPASSIHGWAYINCTSDGGTYGCLTGITQSAGIFKDCTFSNSNYGIYHQQSTMCRHENNTFINCGVDVYLDQYCGDLWFYKNTHTTPTTQAFQRATGSGGTVYIIGDTIDNASRHKLLNIPQYSGLQNKRAYWALQDAFGFTGLIYPYAQIIKEFGASPRMEWTFSSVPADGFPFFFTKVLVKEGVGVDIDYSLSVPSAITANITPVIYLNGEEIQSETAISSFSTYTTWTDYTINVSGGSITDDGLLEVGFKVNSGSGTIYYKCTDVT